MAVRSLRRYFKRMGFVRIAKSPYHALAVNARTPSLADLIKPARRLGAHDAFP
jgi:hypothetical protein